MINFEHLQLIVSGALFGLIWLIQLVHYPSFAFYNEEKFYLAMKHHQDQISLVVVPLMLVELSLAIGMAFTRTSPMTIFVLVLVLSIWAITFTVHVPLHNRLLKDGFDLQRILKLVSTNWSRTLLWTIKLFVIFGTTI